MKTIQMIMMMLLALALLEGNAMAAFESGSTCGAAFYNASTCSGAYTPPTTNTTIQLPPSGILDYTTFTVPSGYTVTFTKNAAKTPVYIRTSGNVTIAGTINVSAGVNGSNATNSGTAGDGNLGDDGQPGTSGPSGFDGGRGGLSPLFGGATGQPGGAGKGPGGGNATSGLGNNCDGNAGKNGGGGGFGTAGGTSNAGGTQGAGGPAYGQASLLPLIGGSGGAGGAAGASYNGAGGGGGGGAILITSSGTISFSGTIYANGGAGGNVGGSYVGGTGGGGSGGAIRLVADVLTRTGGAMYANGGAASSTCNSGGGGAAGRIRLEANTITGWTVGNTSPDYTFGLPGHVFVPNSPTLSILSVTPTSGSSSGVTANTPANPTGNADITFPTGTTTATVSLSAFYVPTGSTATVYVIPSSGAGRTSALSSAFSGDPLGVTTATATVTLSPGNNVLLATVTYTVTETVAMNLPTFDNGERVAKIRVEGGMDGKSKVTYITASGKEYPAAKAKV